jgi:rRNA maturation RNase YbeY
MEIDRLIQFFYEDVEELSVIDNKLIKWLKASLLNLKKPTFEINYVLCSDGYLLKVNQDFLDHDYYTDIITFNNSEPNADLLEADIFVSVDRVKENAENNRVDFEEEFKRVLIHGLLHLAGYNDKTEEEQVSMRAAEDKFLALQQ